MATSKLERVAEREFRDEQLEKELLAYVLKRKPTVGATLDPEWFGNVVLSRMLRAAKTVHAPMTKANLLEVMKRERLIDPKERSVYLEIIGEVYSTKIGQMNERSARIAREQLVTLYEGRSILYGVKDVIGMLGKSSIDEIKQILVRLGRGVQQKESNKSGTYIEGMRERVRVIREKQRTLDRGGSVGIPTGIRHFDMMTGGLIRPEFGIVIGQSAVGKTAMLGSLARTAWQNDYNVLFVTGEMPKIDIEFRLDSDIAGISATKFRLGNMSEFDMKKWKQAVIRERDERESFLEIVSFPRNFSVADVETHANEVQDKHEAEIDLVLIDFVNIMSPSTGHRYQSSKDWEAQADVIWEVKSFCSDFNDGISLWTAGQVTDEAIDADFLHLSNVKYGRAIAETCPIVVGLVRNHDERYEHTLELQVLKMRNAEVPDEVIVLHPNLDYMRIHEQVESRTVDLLETEPETVRKKVREKFAHKRRREEEND